MLSLGLIYAAILVSVHCRSLPTPGFLWRVRRYSIEVSTTRRDIIATRISWVYVIVIGGLLTLQCMHQQAKVIYRNVTYNPGGFEGLPESSQLSLGPCDTLNKSG